MFSNNAALRRYGRGAVYSPAFIFNGRHGHATIGGDNESLASAIININKARFLDSSNIIETIDNRSRFEEGSLVLIHRKHVLACAKLGCATRKLKLLSYWEAAKLINYIDDQNLLVALSSGITRKVHRKQVRNISNELYAQHKEAFDAKQKDLP